MARTKKPTSPSSAASPVDLAGFDAALGAIVSSGWAEAPAPRVEPDPPIPEPVDEPQALQVVQAVPAALPALVERAGASPSQVASLLPARREREDSQEPEPPNKAVMDIGLLADFVTGTRNAEDTAAAAGVTVNELHSVLATTLTQVDPKEMAKAMGVQIAVTQLKAGAVFNALLADLLEDIRMGRAKSDTKLELMKILKGVGRLEPKEDKGVGVGGGFQLNINISGADAKPVVIDASN